VKFSKKVKISLFISLILINLGMRYPKIISEVVGDGLGIHWMALQLTNTGFGDWIIHPYSVFGLVPQSYPSAFPFILSEINQLTGFTVVDSLLIFSCFLGSFSIFAAYLLGKEVFPDNDVIPFYVAFTFSMSSGVVQYTYWNGSSRGMLIVMMPLIIWMIFRFLLKSQERWKYFGLIILYFIVLLSVHRMAILTFLFMLTIIFAFLFARLNKKQKVFKKPLYYLLPVSLFWMGLFFWLQFRQWGFYSTLNTMINSGIRRNPSQLQLLLNTITDITAIFGVMLVLAVIGFLYLFFYKQTIGPGRKRKNRGNLITLTFILLPMVYLPVYFPTTYTTLATLIFISIFSGYGLLFLINSVRKFKKSHVRKLLRAINVTIVTGILISTIFFADYMVDWGFVERGDAGIHHPRYITYDQYQVSTFLYTQQSDFLVNDQWRFKIMDLYYEREELFPDVRLERITLYDVKPVTLHEFIMGSDTLYKGKADYPESRFSEIFNTCDDVTVIDEFQTGVYSNISVILINNYVGDSKMAGGVGGLTNTKFFPSITNTRYKIYESDMYACYYYI